ncbi:MAG TPA: tetratricopeptide repeat protein [Verrucomicrobiota bacterium]|nr:tetratricopeptide repeat protein [Verrucomicrobiota bacterium]
MKRSVVVLWLVLAGSVAVLSTGCTAKSKAARHFNRAEGYFKQGQYDKAEIEYLNALRRQPANPPAMARLGEVYYQQGRYLQAMPFLLKTLEQDTNNLDARLKAATIYLAGDRPKEARVESLKILAQRPAHDEALFLLAQSSRATNEMAELDQRLQTLRRAGSNQAGIHLAAAVLAFHRRDLKTAEAALGQAAALDPKSANVQLVRGGLSLAQTNLAGADQAFKAAADLAPVRSLTRLKYVDFKLQTGAVEDAKKLAEAIVDQAPDFVPAQVPLFKIAMSQGKLDDTESLVKKVLARDPINSDALLMSAQVQLARGKPAGALKEMERMNAVYPKSPSVQYHFALAHLLNADVPKAVASLNAAIALEPEYADAILLLAEINIRKGDTASAIAALTQLLQKRPGLVKAHMTLASAYRVKGSLDEALAVYRRLMPVFPKEPQLPFLAGLILRDQRKPAEALKLFEQSLALAPDNFVVIQQMVELQLGARQYDAARRLLEAPLAKDPKASPPRVLLAMTYLAQTNLAQAEALLKQTIELDPNARPAYMLLSQLAVAGGKPEQALERLETVVSQNPKDVQALMQIAMINETLKNYSASQKAYEKILELNPRFAPALNNLAYIYVERLGRVDEAYDLARRAREVLPNDPYSADTLGWVAFKRGDYAWAVTLLSESAKAFPTDPEVQYHLGMAHYMMGEEEPARAALERAAQATKEFSGKPEAERALALLAIDPGTADRQAVARLEQRLAERPGDPVALTRIARVYEQTGAPQKAVKAYEAGVKANPKVALLQVQLAELEVSRQQNPARALELAHAARSLEPEDARIGHRVGRVASLAGDAKWGLSLLQTSAQRLPGDATVLYDLAVAFYGVGRWPDAANTLRRALEADPKFPQADAARRLQEMIALGSNPAQAVQSLARVQEILKADPQYTPAEMVLAIASEQQGNAAAARQSYERVLARNPQLAFAARNLAILIEKQGADDKRAADLATTAREAYPDDADLARTLGMLAYRRGDFGRATQFLKESARKRANDAELSFYLGMSHYRLDQKAESRQALQGALALKVRDDLAREAQRVLQELK